MVVEHGYPSLHSIAIAPLNSKQVYLVYTCFAVSCHIVRVALCQFTRLPLAKHT
jgi:hypothetical protein